MIIIYEMTDSFYIELLILSSFVLSSSHLCFLQISLDVPEALVPVKQYGNQKVSSEKASMSHQDRGIRKHLRECASRGDSKSVYTRFYTYIYPQISAPEEIVIMTYDICLVLGC